MTNLTSSNSGNYTCYTIVTVPVVDYDNETLATNISSSQMIANNRVFLKVRTIPGAVAFLNARITTIVGILMWKWYDNKTGGYPIKCFTADFRMQPAENETNPNVTKWIRMDPSHITPNAVSIIFI